MRDIGNRDRFALEVIYVEALLCEIENGFPYQLMMKQWIHQAFGALKNEIAARDHESPSNRISDNSDTHPATDAAFFPPASAAYTPPAAFSAAAAYDDDDMNQANRVQAGIQDASRYACRCIIAWQWLRTKTVMVSSVTTVSQAEVEEEVETQVDRQIIAWCDANDAPTSRLSSGASV
jgi:hypothetical protein